MIAKNNANDTDNHVNAVKIASIAIDVNLYGKLDRQEAADLILFGLHSPTARKDFIKLLFYIFSKKIVCDSELLKEQLIPCVNWCIAELSKTQHSLDKNQNNQEITDILCTLGVLMYENIGLIPQDVSKTFDLENC